MSPDPATPDRHRLDRWLWHTRFFKSRSLAAEAVGGGRVKLDGERVKPAHTVRVGQTVAITLGERSVEVQVLALPERRGPAAAAQRCYTETATSIARSERFTEQNRLAAMSRPRPDHRPEKHERRALERLRRRQG